MRLIVSNVRNFLRNGFEHDRRLEEYLVSILGSNDLHKVPDVTISSKPVSVSNLHCISSILKLLTFRTIPFLVTSLIWKLVSTSLL